MTQRKGKHSRDYFLPLGFVIVAIAGLIVRQASAQASLPHPFSPEQEADVKMAIEQFRHQSTVAAQYDYVMTARVRPLFFWVGKDDVGEGYIRRGISPDDNRASTIELLMGSDPVKAPRAINRWGAASELFQSTGPAVQASTFFGFMKTSKGNSPGEMEKELTREAGGEKFLFSAIIDHTNPSGEFVKVLPFASDTDFTIHDLDRVVPDVLGRLAGPKAVEKTIETGRWRSAGCAGGFLSSVARLVDIAIEAPKEHATSCYFYNGEPRRVTLQRVTSVAKETVELSLFQTQQKYVRSYRDLVLAQIENFNEKTREKSSFQLLLGTKGDLCGVPVRITYQPNWWFQVVLNLRTPSEKP